MDWLYKAELVSEAMLEGINTEIATKIQYKLHAQHTSRWMWQNLTFASMNFLSYKSQSLLSIV